ncbi:MAG: hypothetical protein JO115_08870 [Pseudonocardiales bacterium]|nr:hypothetical protein [Pseudonocardiales bacterium]
MDTVTGQETRAGAAYYGHTPAGQRGATSTGTMSLEITSRPVIPAWLASVVSRSNSLLGASASTVAVASHPSASWPSRVCSAMARNRFRSSVSAIWAPTDAGFTEPRRHRVPSSSRADVPLPPASIAQYLTWDGSPLLAAVPEGHATAPPG